MWEPQPPLQGFLECPTCPSLASRWATIGRSYGADNRKRETEAKLTQTGDAYEHRSAQDEVHEKVIA